ncbi:MFS transporter [Leptospira kobayashii]|uniref:MFS transporter n=1 Tax=Leptospira kobayashii TaxID=1917830 RepID=A0ABN6KCP4_9LEPT|nr:MFS transporter [Leptospira kobayashii]BDA77376.1 MFS transporter [Leptospira kobayashii]
MNEKLKTFFIRINLVLKVQPQEIPILIYSSLCFFCILSSYYILRPIRDELGIETGTKTLPWLFSATLVSIILLNFPFAWLTHKLNRKSLLNFLFRFFLLQLLAFAFFFSTSSHNIWIGRIFFVWVSVFNLFVVSVFWVLIVDLFREEEGKRLFGIISAGGSIGAIAGSLFTASLVEHTSKTNLLIASAILLELAAQTGMRMYTVRTKLQKEEIDSTKPIVESSSLFWGLLGMFRSPYLANAALYVFIYTATSSLIYFQQVHIFETGFSSTGERTSLLAKMDLIVNVSTLIIQILFTSRIIQFLGVSGALAALPIIGILGFGFLSVFPSIALVFIIQITRRVGQFALAKPTREVLFTLVSKEDKFKAKNFMDTAVYRLGDQSGAWIHAFFSFVGMNPIQISMLGIGASLLWLWNGIWLGKKEKELVLEAEQKPASV